MGAAHSTEAQASEKIRFNGFKSDMDLCNGSPLGSVLRKAPLQFKTDQVAGGCHQYVQACYLSVV